MSKKSNDIQRYLSSIGKTEHLHVFVGKSSTTAENNTIDSSLDLWRDMTFSKKISKYDVMGVIPNIPWVSGNVYHPWKSSKQNTGAYYAWNKENGTVYLCIQNNEMSRLDLDGLNASTYIPNHSYGIQAYPDGYSWLPLYRITGDLLRFVKTEWIPVVSFEDFEEEAFTSEFLAKSSFCNGNVGGTGNCSLYFKNSSELQISGVSFDHYEQGELYTSVISDCDNCYTLFNNSDKFIPKFYDTGSSIPSTITVESKYDLIGRLVSENKISPSTSYYALYDIANNGPNDGAIISAHIDLTGITGNDLIVNQSNPSITIDSSTGSGAVLKFKTYNTINGKYVISGVLLSSGGLNYRDAVLDISSSVFDNANIKDVLLSAISLNFDEIDGLNVDPYDILNCNNVMVDTRIDTNELSLSSIALPDEINIFGLVSNPIEETANGDFVIAGSELSAYGSKLKSGATTLAVVYPGDEANPLDPPSVNPVAGNALSTSLPAGTAKTNYSTKILRNITDNLGLAVYDYPISIYESVITVSGLDYSNIDDLTEITDANNETFNVNYVLEKPSLSQYSGKVLQTKKLSKNLKLTTTDNSATRVIRINMIKGI